MKNYNKKKIITISVLAVAAVLLAGGLWVYVDSMGNSEPPSVTTGNTGEQDTEVDVQGIKIPDGTTQDKQGAGSETPETTVTPDAGGTPSVSGGGTSGQAKPSDGKPKTPAEATPPPTPETEHGSASNSNNTPSSSTPATSQPETSTPQSGDKKDGKIYIPGFGWVEDEGGGVEVDEAPNAGTGEKVGDM